MATPQSIQGLFGGMGTPEEMQRQLIEQKAAQFAEMNQNQQLSAMGYKGGANLGRGIAGAFGVDIQDPTIQRALRLRQLASQYNTNTAKGLRDMAAALQSTDPESAFQLTQRAQAMDMEEAKLGSEQALKTQRERERDAADPFQKLLEKGVYTPASLALYKVSKNVSDLKYKDKEFSPSEIQTLQEYRKTLISPAQDKEIAEVNAVIKAAGEGKGTKIVNEIPGLKGTGDIVNLRQNLNATLKPYRDAVNAADSAIALADDVLKTGNFASFSALSRQLAKASGETQLSKSDVDAFGADPSLIGMVSDVVSKLATGTPSEDSTRKLKQLAQILKKKNQALEENEIKQTQRTAELSGLYKPEQIKEVFTLRGTPSTGTERTTKSGVKYSVGD
jgi:hypothetical protein